MKLLTRKGFLGALLAALLVSGCTTYRQVASKYPKSDIEAIYENALPNPQRNPVVLIHGFAGATLKRQEDGATVWGAFFTKNSVLPSKEAGLRAFALDIGDLEPPVDQSKLAVITDDTQAVELLQKVKADAVVADINVSIYASLVELMEKGGYGPCGSEVPKSSDSDKPPCLTFFYDWRQDNVGNAIALGRFLENARRQLEEERRISGAESPEPVRFDVVAHSMGGLISRYFLRFGARDVLEEKDPPISWDGADYIDRLVLIATPNFGSMKVLRELILGRHYPVVKFEPALVTTWVSPYQMLPREHHQLWLDEQGQPTEANILSAEVWERNGWGPFAPGQDRFLEWIFPEETTALARRQRMVEFMSAAFDRAARFYRAMDRPALEPCPTEMVLFAADVQPTVAKAIVVAEAGQIRLVFEGRKGIEVKAPGDGSVTRASAMADERLAGGSTGWLTSPIPWDREVFLTDTHRTFLGNPTFHNNLLHILLETPPAKR